MPKRRTIEIFFENVCSFCNANTFHVNGNHQFGHWFYGFSADIRKLIVFYRLELIPFLSAFEISILFICIDYFVVVNERLFTISIFWQIGAVLSFNHQLDDSFYIQNSKPTDERTKKKVIKKRHGIFQMNRFLFHVYTKCKSNKATTTTNPSVHLFTFVIVTVLWCIRWLIRN